jgi:hypothetical protein
MLCGAGEEKVGWASAHRKGLPGNIDGLKPILQLLVAKGKSGNIAITAVARELLGFIWAIACEVEQGQFQERRVA